MPKLNDIWVAAEASDGTRFESKASVTVSVDGEFSVELDDCLYEISRALLYTRIAPDTNDQWKSVVSVKASHGKWRVISKALKHARRFCEACASDFIRGQETTERIIAIRPLLNAVFWKNGKSIFPNGAGVREGQWWESKLTGEFGGTLGHGDGQFGVGLSAVVFDKITTKRASGETVRYERVRNPNHNHEQEEHPAYMLNSFSMTIDPDTEIVKQIPYSDEAALFFCDVARSICLMVERLDSFLSEEGALEKAIKNRVVGLIGFGS